MAAAYDAMVKRGRAQPRAGVYEAFVTVQARAGNLEQMRRWADTMVEKGLAPGAPVLREALAAYKRAGRLPEGKAWLAGLVAAGVLRE
mmetsp:Transcript_20183/g.44885  ORF Transcript_20183/g.44885 Transcript_20183/m.44885 type:complete len:88 (-) Transcript_20183:88-351(-)